jgi:hypothetical protein
MVAMAGSAVTAVRTVLAARTAPRARVAPVAITDLRVLPVVALMAAMVAMALTDSPPPRLGWPAVPVAAVVPAVVAALWVAAETVEPVVRVRPGSTGRMPLPGPVFPAVPVAMAARAELAVRAVPVARCRDRAAPVVPVVRAPTPVMVETAVRASWPRPVMVARVAWAVMRALVVRVVSAAA